MVRHSFPQTATGEIATNTNFPPQSGGENTSSPVGGTMEYEDFVTMEFEDLEDMDYESGSVIPEDWFDTSFKSRIALTINSPQVISGPQTDFQMLINSTFSDMIGKVQSLGQDIRFAGIDKVQLPYEIEKFNAGSGNLTAWTKKTINNGEIIYMYFNNPSVTDEQNSANVWNVNNLAVWHLNQTTFGIGTTIDSTSNGIDGTTTNMDATNQVAGKIDGTLSFNAIDEKTVFASAVLNALSNNYTVMYWSKPNVIPSIARRIFSIEALPGGICVGTVTPTSLLFTSFGVLDYVGTVPTMSVGVNTHLTFVLDSSNDVSFFTDGVFRSKVVGPAPTIAHVGTYNIGLAAPPNSYDGETSEFRIYSTALSSDKIQTIFNNENDPDSPAGFYSIGIIQNI